MAEYLGYEIITNPETGKWEVFWKGKKVHGEFVREADAEEWMMTSSPRIGSDFRGGLRSLHYGQEACMAAVERFGPEPQGNLA
jgi:hypothetical protein